MNNYDFPNLSLKFRKTGSGFKQAGSRMGLDLNRLNLGWVKKRARALNGLGRLRVGLKSGWVAKRVGSKTGWVHFGSGQKRAGFRVNGSDFAEL